MPARYCQFIQYLLSMPIMPFNSIISGYLLLLRASWSIKALGRYKASGNLLLFKGRFYSGLSFYGTLIIAV